MLETIQSVARAAGQAANNYVAPFIDFAKEHPTLAKMAVLTVAAFAAPQSLPLVAASLLTMSDASSGEVDLSKVGSSSVQPKAKFSTEKVASQEEAIIEDEFFDAVSEFPEGAQPAVIARPAEQEPAAVSASKQFSSKIPVPVKKSAAPVVASTVSETTTSSKVKNRLEDFIARIKETKDAGVLKQLAKLSAFDFQSSRIREKLGSKLGIDLSNINLADSSIQRIRITAGRNLAMAASAA